MTCKKQGFTLIELLVVVLIIGILSAVALPQYQRSVEKARVAEALAVLNTLRQAADVYILENGYSNGGLTLISDVPGFPVSIQEHSKFFVYYISRGTTFIHVLAHRIGINGSTTTSPYYIMWTKEKATNQWALSCVVNGNYGIALDQYICSSLNSQYATGS